MHKTNALGQVTESSCDFCSRVWDQSGTEIMIEGHQGSLICLKCLSAAYAAVVLHSDGEQNKGRTCTMCLEERNQAEWESPVNDGRRICLRCMKQSATALEKDPEVGWTRPGGKPGTPVADDDDE
jgi:hypothetical protein